MVYYSSAFILILACSLMFLVCRADDRVIEGRKELAKTIAGELDGEIHALIQRDSHEEYAQQCTLEAERTTAEEQKAFLLRRARVWMHKAEQSGANSS
jgi:hypothetical protein